MTAMGDMGYVGSVGRYASLHISPSWSPLPGPERAEATSALL